MSNFSSRAFHAPRRRRALLSIGAGALLMALSGCAQYALVEAGSLIYTGKTLGDHAASRALGADCSVTHITDDNSNYCQSHEAQNARIEREPQYCYKSLGEVTCYTTPDPDPATQALQ